MRLSSQQIIPYMSPYLAGGWQQDELVLESVDVETGMICGRLRVGNCFMPSDGVFHLTVPLSFIWVAQLAIILACWEHNLPEKPGEVFLRSIALDCKRMVTKTTDISILLRVESKRYLGTRVLYVGGISVDDDAFVGTGKFIFPLPENLCVTPDSVGS